MADKDLKASSSKTQAVPGSNVLSAHSEDIALCTLRRGLLYLRALDAMNKRDQEVVSSEDLAGFLCLTDTTVRRDLSAFGRLGTRGLGYRVGDLRTRLLEVASPKQIIFGTVVGVGRLGQALLRSVGVLRVPGLVIRAAFDIDVQKIGSVVGNVRVLDASGMAEAVKRQSIAVALVTVPAEAAQVVVDRLVEGGVSAVLNFAPVHVTAPKSVLVSNMDIFLELESLLLSLASMGSDKQRGADVAPP
ncbi:MAG: redox-sensing transcriptional repressor Rex [Phycisphaerae bacterium]